MHDIDYIKELIEYLRATANEMTAADVHAFGVDDDVVVESEDAGMLRNAADAIEQLVKERDAAVIDAEPVRHGHWVRIKYVEGDWMRCSACEENIWTAGEFAGLGSLERFCPHCGAKMDEEVPTRLSGPAVRRCVMDPRNETLVRLLSTGAFEYDCNDICYCCKYAGHRYCEEEKLADYLLANGVVVEKDFQKLVSDYEILAKMYAKVNEDLCRRTTSNV